MKAKDLIDILRQQERGIGKDFHDEPPDIVRVLARHFSYAGSSHISAILVAKDKLHIKSEDWMILFEISDKGWDSPLHRRDAMIDYLARQVEKDTLPL